MNTSFLQILHSVFYKESIKTFPMIVGIFLFNLCFLLWNFLTIRKLFNLDHSEVVWFRVMNLGQIPYQNFAFIPLLSALVFCIYQFLQEMRDARIRISLHLPCDSSNIVLFHALFGLVFLTALYMIDFLILRLVLQYYFPIEVSHSAFLSCAPWFLAGFFAYLGITFTLLEPRLKRKTLGALISFILCVQLLMYKGTGIYIDTLWVYILLLPIMLYLIPVSTNDYRNRWV